MKIEDLNPTTENPSNEVDDEDNDDVDDAAQGDVNTSTTPSAKKKKKKPKKKAAVVSAAVQPGAETALGEATKPQAAVASAVEGSLGMKALQSLVEKLGGLSVLESKPTTFKEAKGWSNYKFWSTQPVPKTDETVVEDGVIEDDKTADEIQKEPYELKGGFEWSTLDINDEAQIKEVYELLTQNYVEDDDAMFRFDYSAEFLKWALQPPGWKKIWHLGVRVSTNKKLVAFISGIPADISIHQTKKTLVEINFLCVHKKLRSKRLAPLLIKEITRLVNLEGIFQAVYTAGAFLPKPFSTCRYYHRSLNPKKLIETGFSALSRRMTMASTIKLYRLPESPLLPGTRKMEARDVSKVCKLVNEYLSRFEVAPHLSEDEVKHWLLPLETVVYSCVVEDPETKEITDFYSFYSLPSSVIGNPKHSHIRAAYLFYYAPKGMGADKKRFQDIIKDALILAKNNGFDVFNCLDLMDNKEFLTDLKFGRGDGNLHYYFYNYRCRDVAPEKLGLVLLEFHHSKMQSAVGSTEDWMLSLPQGQAAAVEAQSPGSPWAGTTTEVQPSSSTVSHSDGLGYQTVMPVGGMINIWHPAASGLVNMASTQIPPGRRMDLADADDGKESDRASPNAGSKRLRTDGQIGLPSSRRRTMGRQIVPEEDEVAGQVKLLVHFAPGAFVNQIRVMVPNRNGLVRLSDVTNVLNLESLQSIIQVAVSAVWLIDLSGTLDTTATEVAIRDLPQSKLFASTPRNIVLAPKSVSSQPAGPHLQTDSASQLSKEARPIRLPRPHKAPRTAAAASQVDAEEEDGVSEPGFTVGLIVERWNEYSKVHEEEHRNNPGKVIGGNKIAKMIVKRGGKYASWPRGGEQYRFYKAVLDISDKLSSTLKSRPDLNCVSFYDPTVANLCANVIDVSRYLKPFFQKILPDFTQEFPARWRDFKRLLESPLGRQEWTVRE
ncbi:Glycylpeptide N-tetradecanoyltransferase 2 [Dinochytrium kinnereticum]|nr:Glycylpeptide N-tetradecanoyltransferase 2 [Dinochytrium kinnereticum]